MLYDLWTILPQPWNIFLFLAMTIVMVGFWAKLSDTENGRSTSSGELIAGVGFVLLFVVWSTAPAPHCPKTCTVCSVDQQQLSRPGYDWMERQRQLDLQKH